MGLLLSRVRNDPYYASYEKRFEKLDAECLKLEVQTQQLHQISGSITGYYLLVAAALTIFAAAHAAWVHQLPPGTFEWDEHLLRTAPVVVLPMVLWLGHEILLRFFKWKANLRRARLTKLMEKKRKMIKEVKDMTKFDKVSEFLQKWDPDHAPPVPVAPASSSRMSGAITSQSHRVNSTPELLYRLTGGAASAAVGAAAEAGKSLLPLLDKVAQNVVGDSPMLVHDIRRLHHQVQAAEARAQHLVMENSVLKQQNTALIDRLKELDPSAVELVLSAPYLLDPAQSSYGVNSAASRDEEATSSSRLRVPHGVASHSDAADAGPSRSSLPPTAPGSKGQTPRDHGSSVSEGCSTSSQPISSNTSPPVDQELEEDQKGVHRIRTADAVQQQAVGLSGHETTAS